MGGSSRKPDRGIDEALLTAGQQVGREIERFTGKASALRDAGLAAAERIARQGEDLGRRLFGLPERVIQGNSAAPDPRFPDYLARANPTARMRSDPQQFSNHEAAIAGPSERIAYTPEDVKQGVLGDCYLMGQLAAIAALDPQRLEGVVEKVDAHHYKVRLHVFHSGEKVRRPTEFLVDDRFPALDVDQHNTITAYAQPTLHDGGRVELWPMLIEKAFAQHAGSYEAIEGHNLKDGLFGPGDVMAAISGEQSTVYAIDLLRPEHLRHLITNSLAEGRPIVLSSRNDARFYTAHHTYYVVSANSEGLTLSDTLEAERRPEWYDFLKKEFYNMAIGSPRKVGRPAS